ncbi:MAG: glycosyl hydrolase family 5 [Thiobacillus sp.]|nr:glycosyl hydrolase family 5 [Thiobacillus sp.]
MTRRQLVRGLVGFGVIAGWPLAAGAITQRAHLYDAWKGAFVRPDGRVVDPAQRDASTSEGQGYGMILALEAGDEAGFDAMWAWTQQHLAVRGDPLLAWRWLPGQGVSDRNDASDGDLLVAWALARASLTRPALAAPARALAEAIRTTLLRDTAWGTVLLPAVEGFDTPAGQVVNLSYWVFPAFAELARVDPSPKWEALRDSGLRLLSIARFGRWALPPDWLLLINPLAPDPNRPQRYGYEAVRIPLYLAWAGLASPERIAPFRAFWSSFRCEGYLPAWANFADDSIDSYGASPGMRAIRDWLTAGAAPPADGRTLAQSGYYSATLAALVQAASRQMPRPPAPGA